MTTELVVIGFAVPEILVEFDVVVIRPGADPAPCDDGAAGGRRVLVASRARAKLVPAAPVPVHRPSRRGLS